MIEIPKNLTTVDKHGNRLMALHRASESSAAAKFSPLKHSLVVGEQVDSILFVYNRWKKKWELPGGIIEDDETAMECAKRELYEETRKSAVGLSFYCIMEWRLGTAQKTEYGALYRCTIAGPAEPINSNEIGDTLFWDLHEHIGDYAELDRTLALVVTSSLRHT